MINPFFLKQKFRTGTAYCLTEWQQLSRYELELISGLCDSDEVYGIFQPLKFSAEFTSKIAYKDVALLYMHLEKYNVLPHCYTIQDERKLAATIAQLVFDNILETEWNGNFVSGTAAVSAVYGSTLFSNNIILNHITILSARAIDYALMLRNTGLRLMAYKLYSYNTAIADETLKTVFEKKNVGETLCSSLGSAIEKTLSHQWDFSKPKKNKEWLTWVKKEKYQATTLQNENLHKMYISLPANEFFKSFEKIVSAIAVSPAYSFKTASSLHGLLRPDKMVVYFKDKNFLTDTAVMLEKELRGCAAQGVPFTKQLDATGILSCGVDPLKKDVLKRVDGGSWRTTVTDRLAAAIIQTQKNKLDNDSSIDFIKAKLLSGGIDMQTWTPLH